LGILNELITSTNEQNTSNLVVCNNAPEVSRLISEIRLDRKGGQPLRDRLYHLGQIMGNCWQNYNPLMDNGIIVGIPRSGIPMSKGLSSLLPSYPYYLVNNVNGWESNEEPDCILIVDSVIVTGETMSEAVKKLANGQKKSDLFIFSAVASESGIRRLLWFYPNLKIYVGERAEIIYRFDHYRRRQVATLEGFGNIGSLISKD